MFAVIKGLITLLIIAALAAWLSKAVLKKAAAQDITRALLFYSLIFVCFLIHNFYIAMMAMALLPLIAIKQRSDIAGGVILVVVSVPALSMPLMSFGLPLAPLSPAHVIFIALSLCQLRFNRVKSSTQSADLFAILIGIMFVIMNARGTSPTNYFRELIDQFLNYILPCILIRRNINSFDDIRRVSSFSIFAVFVVCLTAVYESYVVWPIYQTIREQYGIVTTTGAKMRGGLLRAGGPLMNPPLSSSLLVISSITIFCGRVLFKQRSFYHVGVAVVIAGIFFMQSRTAWVGLAAALLALMAIRGNVRGMFGILIVGGGATALLMAIATINARVGAVIGLGADSQGSNDYRRRLLTRGIETVQHHPLFGQSYADITQQLADMRQGEQIIDFVNSYLTIALTTGILGLLVFIGSLTAVTWFAIVVARKRSEPPIFRMASVGSTAAISLAAMLPFVSLDSRIISISLVYLAFTSRISAVSLLRRPVSKQDAAASVPILRYAPTPG